MLKKFKILLVIIALTAAGTVLVLSIWLYGSYKNRQELFLGLAERSLLNVLQNYAQNASTVQWKKEHAHPGENARKFKPWLDLVQKVYPQVEIAKLRNALDTVSYRTLYNRKMKQSTGRSKESPEQLLPWYLLEKIDFTPELLDSLESRLTQSLARNGIKVAFELKLEEIKPEEFDQYYGQEVRKVNLLTRPILVNPSINEYLIGKFQQPWSYFLAKMGWQLLFSLFLLTAMLGTFVYLLQTIKKQNELALLRKSFVNNMTHELKTPVATVMAAIEAIQFYVAKDDRAKMERYLEVSKHELEHLHHMIETVLQLNVDEGKGVVLHKGTFDFVALLDANIEAAQLSSKKEVQITKAFNQSEVWIYADEAHIRNVVTNLLDNAIKYSEEPVRIHVELQENDEAVTLEIEDKGMGIHPSHHKHIFDMLYRVPEGNLHAVKGFGLGLSYVKQVVEQHGGQVGVSSALGEGSTFTVVIPNDKPVDTDELGMK